jgi:hypothetical protein
MELPPRFAFRAASASFPNLLRTRGRSGKNVIRCAEHRRPLPGGGSWRVIFAGQERDQNFGLWQFHDFTIPRSGTSHVIARKRRTPVKKLMLAVLLVAGICLL